MPFALDSADQFRLEAPPAIGTPQYRADIEEVQAYGGLNSTARTREQTDTAQFWLGSSFILYNPVLRAALEHHTGSLRAQVELVALFHVAAVDTQIATSDSKYAHLAWRPITAIAGAVEDGDPATVQDPSWTPLHTTPAHPDYPSGHNTYSGSAEEVLTQLVGDGPGAAYNPEPLRARRDPHLHDLAPAHHGERRCPRLVGHPHPLRGPRGRGAEPERRGPHLEPGGRPARLEPSLLRSRALRPHAVGRSARLSPKELQEQ